MTIISKPTIEVLKNFCTINKSIVIKPGKQVSTLSINKNILAIADVDEQFDSQISIYDLQIFLQGLSLFDQPKIDTTESNYVTLVISLESLRLVTSMQILISLLRHLSVRLLFHLKMLRSTWDHLFSHNFKKQQQFINCQTCVSMEVMAL